MKRIIMRISLVILFASLFVFGVIFAGGQGSSGSIVSTVQAADDVDDRGCRRNSNIQLISESALLSGLAPGALFPFIDTTPNSIVSAHIAITDATTTCAAGAAPPANIQIRVGQAGVQLIPVMTSATNTGIGTATQCVFHTTVTPGSGGFPEITVTDIVVLNTNASAALTGVNTITASAEVCVRRSPGKKQ
ncbi:MAG: hypothetical protein ACR2LM_18650 [Pyrinomonadaceae bacterium]